MVGPSHAAARSIALVIMFLAGLPALAMGQDAERVLRDVEGRGAERVVEGLEATRESDPSSLPRVETLNEVVGTLLTRGDIDGALMFAHFTGQTFEESSAAEFMHGEVHRVRGDDREAGQAYVRSLERIFARDGLGPTLDEYRGLQTRDGGLRRPFLDNPQVLATFATRLLEQRKPADALRVLGMNLERFPESAQSEYLMGEAYRELGNPSEAIAAYRRALDKSPAQQRINELTRENA